MKKWFLLLFIPAVSSAAAPIVTPSTPVVNVGGTVGLTANVAVTWSLATGSSGTINSTTGLYTAPTTYFSANNHHQQTGTILRPNDDIINTRIDALPVDSSSTFRFAHEFTINGGSNSFKLEPTIPTNTYYQNMQTQNMNFRYTPGEAGPFVMLSTFSRMQESTVDPINPSVGSSPRDIHLMGITSDTYHAYEIYDPHPVGLDPAFPSANADSGFIYYTNNYRLPSRAGAGSTGSGTDAAGMAVQPLLLRFSELKSGVINHALRCTLNNPNIYTPSDDGWDWPATGQAFHNNCTGGSKNCFHYGARVRVKSSYDCTALASQGSQAICTALKQYGCFLVDGGTSWGVVTHYDLAGDTVAYRDIYTNLINQITTENMEQVDESSLMISTFTGNVNPANIYVKPPQFAQVIATNNADLTVSSVSIALVPVTVGWTNPVHQGLDTGINVMARTPQFSIPTWVNGSTDTAFNCSMSPTVGSISSNTTGCLYTAPTSQYNEVLVTTVTVKSRIDPNHNAASFYVTVFSTDGIRIRMGPHGISGADSQPPYDANGNFTDTSGNKWFEAPVNNRPPWDTNDTQGSALWPNQMYNNYNGGLYADKIWGFMLPNNPNDPSGTYAGTWIVTSNHGSNTSSDVTASTVSFETQNGRILFSTRSLITATLTPGVFTSTITTSSNSLYYRILAVADTSRIVMSYMSVIFSSATVPSSSSPAASPGTAASGPQRWTGNIKAFSQ